MVPGMIKNEAAEGRYILTLSLYTFIFNTGSYISHNAVQKQKKHMNHFLKLSKAPPRHYTTMSRRDL